MVLASKLLISLRPVTKRGSPQAACLLYVPFLLVLLAVYGGGVVGARLLLAVMCAGL